MSSRTTELKKRYIAMNAFIEEMDKKIQAGTASQDDIQNYHNCMNDLNRVADELERSYIGDKIMAVGKDVVLPEDFESQIPR